MRFYMLSDLHFGENEDGAGKKRKLGKLCAEIRSNPWHDDTVLFVILGDIINAGAGATFSDAKECLDYILSELSEYDVRFEFLPGNHDMVDGDIHPFDVFISQYHCAHHFGSSGAYSVIYDEVNFIFADSNISRDHNEPGLLDLEAIRLEAKIDKQNILFCHHSITHDFGGDHDTVDDGYAVKAKLRDMGISFIFHGHTHRACTTISADKKCEIGCGAYLKDISNLPGINNQFTVGYIRDGEVVAVERWIDVSDGGGGFVPETLFPSRKTFADPNTIGKLQYPPASEHYIPRKVIPHSIAIGDIYERVFSDSKKLPLVDVIRKNNKILLLSDAGNGKTVELQNIACNLYETELFPFLFSLRDYIGGAISNLIPDAYNDLHPRWRIIILDGYDELTPDVRTEFEKQLRIYLADNDMTHILISARSNFCKAERENESSTLEGFDIYDLCELAHEDIVSHLSAYGINSNVFFEELLAKGLIDLKSNPFYLEKLAKIYSIKNNLPVKSELMDYLIKESFETDDRKFSGSIEDRYSELFRILEKLSFAMQLMQKYVFDDRQEYQELFSEEERTLAKHSGLLTRVGAGWQFIHNNFREYLAAKYISRLPSEQAISYFGNGDGIKPSWVNTLGYLTGMKIGWDLKDWLTEHAPNALVKFEPDRVDFDTRYKVLIRIFSKYEEKMLWFHDELCDERELARFSCSDKSLTFLLDKILHPIHHRSRFTALQILRHFTKLYGRQEEVLTCLMECCERFPETSGDICRLAIYSIYELHLNDALATEKLFRIFAECDNDYIRLGMYEYLLATGEHNDHVSFYLEGIQYISFAVGKNTNRIGNEAFELVEGLKNMSTSQSISQVLEWFSTENVIDFHQADEVFSRLCERATKHYANGETALYNIVMRCLQRSAKTYNHSMERSAVSFFEETGTLSQAAIDLARAEAADYSSLFEFFSLAPLSVEYVAQAYQEDRLSNPEIFRKIVRSCITNELQYTQYAELIMKKDGVELPKLRRPKYEDIRKRAKQQYFDMLFDQRLAEEMLTALLSTFNNPKLTIKELFEEDIHFESYSPLFRLWLAMRRYASPSLLAVEFFKALYWPSFILQEAKEILDENTDFSPTAEQRDSLRQIIKDMVAEKIFEDAVSYASDSVSVSTLVVAVLFTARYLDYELDKENLLQLTELPSFCFSKNGACSKYDYLESKIKPYELEKRIIENIKTNKVGGEVLRDHLEFCKEKHYDAAAKKALEICRENGKNTLLRRSALEYLYEVLGVEYISEFVLPYADGEFLTEIAGLCKDIPREELRLSMEPQYKIAPLDSLLAYLITLGSAFALEIYVKDVEDKCCIPEKYYYHEGPTEAIATINDVELLPLLGRLLNVIFNPDFSDRRIRGLNDSLREALINCGKESPEAVIAEVKTHMEKVEVKENSIWFCNYVINEIEQNRRIKSDQPWVLAQVKCLFGE